MTKKLQRAQELLEAETNILIHTGIIKRAMDALETHSPEWERLAAHYRKLHRWRRLVETKLKELKRKEVA